jgi:hypothetical protein
VIAADDLIGQTSEQWPDDVARLREYFPSVDIRALDATKEPAQAPGRLETFCIPLSTDDRYRFEYSLWQAPTH